MSLRTLRRVLLGLLIAGALGAGAGYLALTSPWAADRIRASMVRYLSDKFDADVAIAEMTIALVPRLSIEGSGLTLTRRTDTAGGPFVTLERFQAAGTPLGLLRRHVDQVTLDGFEVRVKRGGQKGASHTRAPRHDVSIDEITVRNGVLLILPRNPEKLPLQFDLERLTSRTSASIEPRRIVRG